jgi:hypothetical protein
LLAKPVFILRIRNDFPPASSSAQRWRDRACLGSALHFPQLLGRGRAKSMIDARITREIPYNQKPP